MSEIESVLAAAGAQSADGVVQHFGDVDRELRALVNGAGLVDRDGRDRVRIVGPDAASFLDRLLTVGVKSMPSGGGGRAFLLDAKGRILLAFDLYRLDDDTFLTDATAGHGAEILERLDMFHFGEQLHFEPGEAALSALGLHGPQAGAVVEALGLTLPEAEGQHTLGRAGPVVVRVARRDLLGRPGYTLFFPPAGYGALWKAAVEAGATPVGERALEARRIEAGVPEHPREHGPHTSPLEMGSMQGITEGKGCYPGQEVIERTLALGRPARTLVRLRLDRHAEPGAELLDPDGKVVGELTSVAPLGDGVVALALLKRRAAQNHDTWRTGDATARRVDPREDAA